VNLGLSGMKAIVTGGSKGIGRDTTRILAEEGCDVAVTARRLLHDLELEPQGPGSVESRPPGRTPSSLLGPGRRRGRPAQMVARRRGEKVGELNRQPDRPDDLGCFANRSLEPFDPTLPRSWSSPSPGSTPPGPY
jgi:hypothetical protein